MNKSVSEYRETHKRCDFCYNSDKRKHFAPLVWCAAKMKHKLVFVRRDNCSCFELYEKIE